MQSCQKPKNPSPRQTEMATRNFQDDFELRSLVLRERYLKDTQQWEDWRDCYHSDSSETWIEIAWYANI